MDLQKFVCGESIELSRMLNARERRTELQQQLLARNGVPLISFTLNIAGPVKVFPMAVNTFEEGLHLILCQCKAYRLPILEKAETRESTGYECFLSVNAPARQIKEALCLLEESSSLGRLFDIDVLDVDGRKISRTDLGLPERTCLICGNPAAVCSRSRAHSVDALLTRTCQIIWDYFAEKYASETASIAARALLYEVLATPKPGLVDKRNSGAHRDMDIFTFESSALALIPYFKAFVHDGIDHTGDSPEAVLPGIRPVGIQAEIAMLHATGGVNTHKGIIFSLGILCAALGRLYGRQEPYSREALREECRQIAAPLAKDFDGLTEDTAVSHGERLYAEYGVRGVRGEAIDGFPALFSVALPRFQELREKGLDLNDAGVVTLLSIMAESMDTNIICRSSYKEAGEIQSRLRALILTQPERQDYHRILEALDEEFIQRNISPGGSADILALTYFLCFLEQERQMNPYLRDLQIVIESSREQ